MEIKQTITAPLRLQIDGTRTSYSGSVSVHKEKEDSTMHVEQPSTYLEELSSADHQKWQQTMDDELPSLRETRTWTLLDTRPEIKTVKSKWVSNRKGTRKGEYRNIKHILWQWEPVKYTI